MFFPAAWSYHFSRLLFALFAFWFSPFSFLLFAFFWCTDVSYKTLVQRQKWHAFFLIFACFAFGRRLFCVWVSSVSVLALGRAGVWTLGQVVSQQWLLQGPTTNAFGQPRGSFQDTVITRTRSRTETAFFFGWGGGNGRSPGAEVGRQGHQTQQGPSAPHAGGIRAEADAEALHGGKICMYPPMDQGKDHFGHPDSHRN